MSDTSRRICLECAHCYVYPGQPGYSEWTPPEGADILCNKRHDLGMGNYEGNKKTLLAGILQAGTCPDFEADHP